ncbi:capsule biosynthesis protein [Campylobacter sp. MIT 99-7217]|uniref:capsule polysaccharide transporter KpsM n=1 Tax=Campylobacter sp. MIT 99-7217 TaxID=535091 RepID=UPI00115A920F|nr:ABC transporter permease [Campylobacter sp. MIT 99-7217]TQR34729.1 capsule biosynthesis protein [Campylobacter sp. MIT 99-7217]
MFNVVYALFFRELKTRFGKNRRLGYFWVIGEPMGQILVILSVVTMIRQYRHFPMPEGISIFMFLATGIIPYFMFRSTVTQMLGGISGNLGLFTYKPVKPIHVFIARTLVESFIYFFIFVLTMILVGWIFHLSVLPYHFLEVYGAFLVLVFSGFALGLCLTILNHFIEPLKSILPYFVVLIYVSSAIIYPSWIVPDSLFEYLLYNPWLHITETIKMNYFEHYPAREGVNILYPIIVSLILLLVGLWVYYYKRQELSAARP